MAPAQSPAWKKQFRTQFKKTKLCQFNAIGQCSYGKDCAFAHGAEDLGLPPDLTKTALCPRWQRGCCPLPAAGCSFAHGAEELRLTPAFAKTKLSDRRQGRSAGKMRDMEVRHGLGLEVESIPSEQGLTRCSSLSVESGSTGGPESPRPAARWGAAVPPPAPPAPLARQMVPIGELTQQSSMRLLGDVAGRAVPPRVHGRTEQARRAFVLPPPPGLADAPAAPWPSRVAGQLEAGQQPPAPWEAGLLAALDALESLALGSQHGTAEAAAAPTPPSWTPPPRLLPPAPQTTNGSLRGVSVPGWPSAGLTMQDPYSPAYVWCGGSPVEQFQGRPVPL